MPKSLGKSALQKFDDVYGQAIRKYVMEEAHRLYKKEFGGKTMTDKEALNLRTVLERRVLEKLLERVFNLCKKVNKMKP